MNQSTLLKIITGICFIQFAAVVFYVLHGGIEKGEMFLVAISGAFGLLLDGFTRSMISLHYLKGEKNKLDDEYQKLTAELNRQNDFHNDDPENRKEKK
ncbi:MAG: hypothetical protein AB1650_01030 [Candidatus Omnitrophota bacterium]